MMSSYFAESLDDNDVETYRKIVLDQIQTNAYQNMQKQRQKLPAYQMKKSIADTLLSPTVTIAVISGETGCG
jgi:HrpA-like RNA helicase